MYVNVSVLLTFNLRQLCGNYKTTFYKTNFEVNLNSRFWMFSKQGLIIPPPLPPTLPHWDAKPLLGDICIFYNYYMHIVDIYRFTISSRYYKHTALRFWQFTILGFLLKHIDFSLFSTCQQISPFLQDVTKEKKLVNTILDWKLLHNILSIGVT